MKRLLALAICTGMMMTSTAIAQTGPGRGPGTGQGTGQGTGPGSTGAMHQQMFDQVDADHDGFISRQEFANAPRGGRRSMTDVARQRRDARFDQADKDKDGKLSREEWSAWTPRKR